MEIYSAYTQEFDSESTFLYQDQEDQQLIEMPDFLISMSKKYFESYDQQNQNTNKSYKKIIGNANKNETKHENLQNNLNNSSKLQDNQFFDLDQTNYSSSKLKSMLPLSKRSKKKNDQETTSKLDGKPQDEVSMFKEGFYRIFTNKRRFRKENVKKIHDIIIRSKFCFRAMTRDEYRSIDRYFEHYAFYKDSILSFLQNNYCRIISQYPELSQS